MRVLIIDDNPDDIAQIKRHLTEIANEIEDTTDADEGVEKATRSNYDCIILDQLMPRCGLDVLKEMREKGVNSPVVMVTGCNDRLLATRCIREGANNYFPKDCIATDAVLFQDCVTQTSTNQFLEASARLALLDRQVKMIEKKLNASISVPNARATTVEGVPSPSVQ